MFRVDIEGKRAYVTTPYNEEFVRRIKFIAGSKWDAKSKRWVIPAEAVDACREIMLEVYGRTDINCGDLVQLKITFLKEVYEFGRAVTLFGKIICRAVSNTGGATVGDGVFFAKGEPDSGGSTKNWYSVVPEGSEVILSDVPETLWAAFDPASRPDLKVEKLEKMTECDRLLEEKERLLDRLEEIEDKLERMKP